MNSTKISRAVWIESGRQSQFRFPPLTLVTAWVLSLAIVLPAGAHDSAKPQQTSLPNGGKCANCGAGCLRAEPDRICEACNDPKNFQTSDSGQEKQKGSDANGRDNSEQKSETGNHKDDSGNGSGPNGEPTKSGQQGDAAKPGKTADLSPNPKEIAERLEETFRFLTTGDTPHDPSKRGSSNDRKRHTTQAENK